MRQKIRLRIIKLLVALALVTLGVVMFLSAIEDNIVFFLPPSKIDESKIGQKIRVGGFVLPGSVEKEGISGTNFILTDHKANIRVSYDGFLPTLFRENQGIVVDGILSPGGVIMAVNILAKHDEYYYPPNNFSNNSIENKNSEIPCQKQIQ